MMCLHLLGFNFFVREEKFIRNPARKSFFRKGKNETHRYIKPREGREKIDYNR